MSSAKVGFFCKSFKPDFDHLSNLLNSLERHNVDQLPLTLSLPREDVSHFTSRFGSQIANLTVVADQDYAGCDLQKLPGWYGQQVCKLMSWIPTGLDHYAVLDSDCYFISDVRAADLTPPPSKKFVVWGSSLRTVFRENENDDLERYIRGQSEHILFPPVREPPNSDVSLLRAAQSNKKLTLEERSGVIYNYFGASRWYYYQPSQIFAAALLIAMKEYFLNLGLSVESAIDIAPWEYNWYGEYAAAFHSENVLFKVSPTLHIASQPAVDLFRKKNFEGLILSNRFLWIQMAARHINLIRL